MLSGSDVQFPDLKDGEIYDPVSKCVFWFRDGSLHAKSAETGNETNYFLPNFENCETTNLNYLKFKKSNQSTIFVSPSGQTLTCKSQRIQEVEMNLSYNSGVVCWSIYSPGNCLGLSIGVKNSEAKKEEVFDFTAQYSTKITLKLDLNDHKFKAWVTKSLNNSYKEKNLSPDCKTWTPFVRIKGMGITLFLSHLVEDPQAKISSFNIFGPHPAPEKISFQGTEKPDCSYDLENYQISKLDANTILLRGQKQVRLLRRFSSEQEFNLTFAHQSKNENKVVLEFTEKQIQLLQKVGINFNENQKGKCYVEKNMGEWMDTGAQTFSYLDSQLKSNSFSTQLLNRAYEILLWKFETIREFAFKEKFVKKPVLEQNREESWGINKTILPLPPVPFSVPKSLSLNNRPPIKYPYKIKETSATQNYLIVLLDEVDRVCILNRENIVFQVSEISLKKGLKKEYELVQYQKELEEVQNSNFNEPSIYKILKNCLKYADKIKPPEKLLKKLEEKKQEIKKEQEKKETPKSNEIIPDKSLLNTLGSMGFSDKLAKKALIECKNSSLETAVDLILNKYSNIQETEKEQKKKTNSKWACELCTLINEPSATNCSACQTPKPPEPAFEVQAKEEEEPPKKEEEEKEVEVIEEIISEDVGDEVKGIFSWETKFAYCPIVIAGVFEDRIRFRIFGPNPKYYSHFYSKDEEFVDLTNFSICEESYQIDQRPIRSSYYLSSSNQQLKENGYGWISIEDQDIMIKDKITNIHFKQTSINKKEMKFRIYVQTSEAKEKVYEASLLLNKVFSEKVRAFKIVDMKMEEQAKSMKEEENVLFANRTIWDSNQMPSNSYISIDLVPEKSIPAENETKVQNAEQLQKVNNNKPFLPVLAAAEYDSSFITYPNNTLHAGQRPLILKHIHGKVMNVENIILERVGKGNSLRVGSVYLSMNPSLLPLKKFKFEMNENTKKIAINLENQRPANYVVIEIEDNAEVKESEVYEEISLVGVSGVAFESAQSQDIKTQFFNNKMEVDVVSKKNQEEKVKYKIDTKIKNLKYDYGFLSEEELEKLISAHPVDINVSICSQENIQCLLTKFKVEGWEIIRKKTIFYENQRNIITRNEFGEILKNFIASRDPDMLQILLKEENRQNRSAILEIEADFNKFFTEYLLLLPFDKNLKNKYHEFLRKFSSFFVNLEGLGNLNHTLILKEALSNEKGTAFGIQLVFELLKLFNLEQSVLYDNLEVQLRQLQKRRPENVKLTRKNSSTPEALTDGSTFSDYYSRQIEKSKVIEVQSFEKKIYSRYIVQKGKFYRKYIIDLVNVYDVENIFLLFEKSERKSSMRINLKSITENGDLVSKSEKFYEPYVWEQLAVKPYSSEMEKIVKNPAKSRFNSLSLDLPSKIHSRYLIIEITFASLPNIGSEKDMETTPQSEIHPEVYGEYVGETNYIHEAFKFDIKSLTFVRNLGYATKYSVELNQTKKVYFYDSENTHPSEKQMMVESKEAMVEAKNESHDSISYLYMISCLVLDELISKGSTEIKGNMVEKIVQLLLNNECGPVSEKGAALLKKIVKVNQKVGQEIFKMKISNESVFQGIFKDSSFKIQQAISILSENRKSTEILNNSIWFAKNKDERVKELCEIIMSVTLNSQKIDEIVVLVEKYGWVNGVVDILDDLRKKEKYSSAKIILKNAKNNLELANYSQKQLDEDFDFFLICLNELFSSSRKVKAEEVKNLLEAFLISLKELCENNSDEQEVHEKFVMLTKTINIFPIEDDLASKYINLFLSLPQKQNYLKEFLNLKIFATDKYAGKLIEVTLELLGEYTKNRSSFEELNLIYEIITFVFRKEVDLEFNDKVSFAFRSFNKVIQIISKFLLSHLCIGGVDQVKIIGKQINMKISILFYLCTLIREDEEYDISEATFGQLLKWMFINVSVVPSNSKAKTSVSFSRIELIVWKLIMKCLLKKSSFEKVLSSEFEKFLKETSKIKNPIFRKIYEKKIFTVSNKLIEEISKTKNQASSNLIKNVFFEQVFNKISKLSAFDSAEDIEPVEQQLVNGLKLDNHEHKQPKDWLLYKNGSKNSVYKFDYPKSTQQVHEIVLKSEKFINLSKIVIGFEYTSTNQETYCIPDDITVEIGQNLDTMKYIGKMTLIPDDHYINYSVRVFGFNCGQISTSSIASALNRNIGAHYIRISIRCPNPSSISDILNLQHVVSSNYGSSINFLSVQGYEECHTNEEIGSLVSFVERISATEHRKTIEDLFKDAKTINLFKEALINISILMKNENYERILHRFVMRVCEVNTQIGNETIEKYLTLTNSSLCARIVSEIVLSNEKQIQPRMEKVHQFISQRLSERNSSLEPFLDRFCQLIFIITNTYKNKEIVCNFEESSIEGMIKDSNKSETIARYLSHVLILSKPFKAEGFNLQKMLDLLNKNKNQLNRDIFCVLVVADQKSRTWFMQNNELEQLFEQACNLIENEGKAKELEDILNAFSSLSQSPRIKNIINKSQYNLKIFELMVKDKYSNIITSPDNSNLRDSFVNFITRSVLGSQNEKVVGLLLKDCLTGSVTDGNQNFVGQVFLPILNSFDKVSVCISPYNEQEDKIIADINTFTKPKKTSKTIKPIATTKFRLPSNILDSVNKDLLFEHLKSKIKSASGSFNLALNHGNQSFGLTDTIETSFLNCGQSLLMLFRLNPDNGSGKPQIFGLYYHHPENTIRSLPLYWNEQSFVFLIKEGEQIKFADGQSQVGKVMVHLHKEDMYDFDSDYSSMDEKYLEFQYNGVAYGEVSFTSEFSSSYFGLEVIWPTKNIVTLQIDAGEYWLFEPSSIASQENIVDSGPSLTEELLLSSNFSFFERQFETKNILRLIRYEKMYEFPASLTIRELKAAIQVMKCRLIEKKNGEIKLKNLQSEEVKDDYVLETITRKSGEEGLIADILFDITNLGELLDFQQKSSTKKTEYLPKKGILKHFQENDGVTSMIKVIKKSIGDWKNKERKEKWSQYAVELEKFSSFPHFFGMYLKDPQTFKLLFDLLSGLPDTEADKKWDELQSKSSQKLLKIVSQILSVDKTSEFREYAMKNDFFFTIVERLRILTGMFKRSFKQNAEKQEEVISPSKKVEDDGVKQVKKKKGVGYGNQGTSNTKWMKGVNEAELSKEFQVIEIILNMIENFLNIRHWKIPKKLMENIYESSLLPYLEDALRAGTLLEISKYPPKFRLVFKMLRTFANHSQLVPILMTIPQNYHPKQTQSIQSLIKSLQNTAVIFLSCLKQNKNQTQNEKISEELANDIINTSKFVEEAIEDYLEANNQGGQEEDMKNILQLPIDKKYRTLMKNLRFDYIDMKDGNRIKHHYSSSFSQNYVPNQTKMIRLAQELADISTALPFEHTNGVYVRCDKDRVDFMQAMIMGSNGTPYAHGGFLFDVYFDDNYPNNPPKVNLTTTGHGKVRFNPNLYACGKVCLSLLGTWRGSASENWDAKVSTLLQVLLSIQAIIMSEEVYFNEPGFEGEQGTTEGEKKNEAYSNIVRYCNIKFAMIDNMRNPPKGFETIIRRHFYVKQHEILDECKKWLLYAEKRPANYISLVNDHNNSWSNEFKKSKTQYKDMLEKAIKELEEEFAKLPVPSINDIISQSAEKKKKRKREDKNLLKKLEDEAHEEIDVAYEKKDLSHGKEIDIHDEKVKDRWSRYIGAMGIDAVSKQAKADILIFGLGPMAMEVVKNVVLSGCRKLTICDEGTIMQEDLSGGFFYTEEDIGKKRLESCLYKIRELNAYVKIDTIKKEEVTPEVLKTYHVVFVTEMQYSEQFKMNQICRQNNVKFLSGECRGAQCRIFNDYGEKFEVLDKNGQQPVEVIIKDITCAQVGVVTLMDGVKNPFEDGEAVLIKNVEGMKHKEQEKKSINETIHKVKVINSKSFEIGNTTGYEPYVRNGTAKNIKTPVNLKFSSMKDVFQSAQEKLPIDENLSFFDFVKMQKNKMIHMSFVALNAFKAEQKRMPEPWSCKDAQKLFQIFKTFFKDEINEKIEKSVKKFAMTCQGYLPPLCAYLGGFISQEIIKAITQKYKPVDSVFYMDVEEIVPEPAEKIEEWSEENCKKIITSPKSRDLGLEIVVGTTLLNTIKNAKLFMIGAGAIGCQLLKNFAMVGLGTGENGKITLTDPDHIENSNLNRQFLFREKHISKPKSKTAAASILLMNPHLKNHISSLLERVSESTKNVFSNSFFESLTVVANALDNVAARRYVDQRCVENKVPLFQSGTLGPKGHTQVIIPYKTESYGSQNDPVEDGEIPHCTLKMFPEETLHCVEWARDIFGKKFSLQPKALLKVLDKNYKPEKDDIKTLTECLTMVTKGPHNFDDCIYYAVLKFYKYFRDDIMQLLYTYPLDAKTKNGEPFWKLPKRPPTPIMKIDPENLLHCTFITSMAVLVAKIYKIPYPKVFRQEKERFSIGKEAAKIKIDDFVPSDEKAKAILKEATEEKEKEEKKEKEQEKEEIMEEQVKVENISEKNELQLYEEILGNGKEMIVQAEQFEKDDDQNGHIDFIFSMANLRALNYKLDEFDWITTKLKAGRIVPALATTTTCVAGLQTLQICKYLKNVQLQHMRNSFLNLAVPSLQMSEPGEVKKFKLTDEVTVNLWDRWEVNCTEETTFGEVYKELQTKYKIFPKGVLQGMSRIDTSKTESGKKEFMSSKLVERLEREEDYIDIIVLFTKNEEDDKILEGVPPVRLYFKK